MSSGVRELEIDQEITKFSLSFAKRIFQRAGVAQSSPSVSPIVPNNFLSPEFSMKIDLASSVMNKSQFSPFKTSNSNTFSNDGSSKDYSSPVVSRPYQALSESIIISVEGTPTMVQEEPSVRKGSSEQGFEDTGVSYFSDDQDDTSSYQMPTVPLVAREEFSHRLQKEGWLEKKSTSMFVGWQKRYFKIKPFEISYAKTPEMMEARKDVRSVNLKAYTCEVTAVKDCNFSIAIDKIQKKLNLRAESLQEAVEWIEFLKEFFNYSKSNCYQDNKYLSRSRSRFSKLDMMTEELLINGADTGDILILAHGQVKQQKQCNKYEHIALVARISGELFLYDALSEKNVRLIRWKDFKENIEDIDSKTVMVKKLMIDDPETKQLISTRICNYITARGDISLIPNSLKTENSEDVSKSHEGEMVRVNSVNLTSSTPVLNQKNCPLQTKSKSQNIDEERSISARLVASIYKSIGLLDAYKSISKYTPMTFVKPLNLLKGAYLLGEQEIVLLN